MSRLKIFWNFGPAVTRHVILHKIKKQAEWKWLQSCDFRALSPMIAKLVVPKYDCLVVHHKMGPEYRQAILMDTDGHWCIFMYIEGY